MTIPGDMLLYWKMNEVVDSGGGTWLDYSGNGYDLGVYDGAPGTEHASASDGTRGRNVGDMINNGAVYQAGDQLDTILINEHGDNDPPGFSWAFWYKKNVGPGDLGAKTESEVLSGNYGKMMFTGSPLTTRGHRIRAYPNIDGVHQIFLYCETDVVPQGVFTGGIDASWHHVAFTYDKTLLRLRCYVDAVLVDELTLADTLTFTTANNMELAGTGAGTHQFYHSDWLLYARELTQPEIQGIYDDTFILYAEAVNDLSQQVAEDVATALLVRPQGHYYRFKENVVNTTKTMTFVAKEYMWLESVAVRTYAHTANSTVTVDIEIDGPMLQFPFRVTEVVGAAETNLVRTLLNNSGAAYDEVDRHFNPMLRVIPRGTTVTINMTSDSVNPTSLIDTVLCLRQPFSRGNR